MSDLLKSLVEQRNKAVKDMRDISTRAAAGEERAEDDESFERASKDVDKFGKLIAAERKALQEDVEQAEALEASMRKAGVREHGSTKDEEKRQSWKDEMREALKEKRKASGGDDEMLPDPKGYLPVTRSHLALKPLELRLAGAILNTADATEGPETINSTLVSRLFELLFDDVTILSAGVQILRTESGEELKFPKLTSRGQMSQANARVAEGGTIQASVPAFAQMSLNAYKYAQISQLSRELMSDSVVDVEGVVAQALNANMSNYLGIDLMSGDGTSKPRGVLDVAADNTAGTVTGATGQTGGLGGTVGGSADEFSKLLDVIWKLKPAYRRNAKFMVNDTTILALRKIRVNGEANNFAWNAGTANTPDTLMGYPLLTDPFMPTAGLGAYSILFADFSKYMVRLVGNTRVEWSTEYAWDTDLVSVKAILRADGDAIDDTAFASFKGGAS